MRILATHPGRYGDQLWAMPTVRALAEAYQTTIALQVSGKYGGLAPLLQMQDYIADVCVDEDWVVQEGAPMTPNRPPTLYAGPHDRVFHLGYETWPTPDLARDVYDRTKIAAACRAVPPLDLETPWISYTRHNPLIKPAQLATGFTDEWFELKLGVVECLKERDIPELACGAILTPGGSRWNLEAGYDPSGWTQTAQIIRDATLFLGCCSALHVLAVALGKPVVCLEPNPHRHNAVFYPLGTHGRVRLVRGGDGLPTFDSRHCADVLKEVLCGL